MYAGAICEEGPTDAVLSHPNHPYTEELLSAVPTVNDATKEDSRIRLRDGANASSHTPTGCRFHPRCPRKIGPLCEQKVPPVVSPSEGHWISCHLPVEELSLPAADVKNREMA